MRSLSPFPSTLLIVFLAFAATRGDVEPFPGPVSEWHGFVRHHFDIDGVECSVVEPKEAAAGRPWIWRARFFGHEPQADIALLRRGYHVAYCDVAGLFGAPAAVARWDAFYERVTRRHGLAERVALEGMSRGGLIIYNWAAAHPDRVACIYADNPVCDIRSWPGGKGAGPGSVADWKACLDAYGITDEEGAKFTGNPIDRLDSLARAKVPLLHIVGLADEVVPVAENTAVIESRYRELGGEIHVIAKAGLKHHPHSLPNPRPIVSFVVGRCRAAGADRSEPVPFEGNVVRRDSFARSRKVFEEGRGHVAFLGGSITEMAGYRPLVMSALEERYPRTEFTFTNAGIASTCSTTGAFRVGTDVLAKGPVDLFLVEFAVNDDQDAGHSAAECVRGMEGIIRQVRRHNPSADIVMIHFVNPEILATTDRGETALTIAKHEEVAERYGVSTVNVARQLSDEILAGTLTWQRYGGVHPGPEGNALAASMVGELLRSTDGETGLRSLPAPLDERSYASGRFLDPGRAVRTKGWDLAVPEWSKLAGGKRERFLSIPLLTADESGAELRLSFRGPLIGAYVVAGPDAGRLEGTIDGAPFAPVDLYHRFSRGLHYPRTVLFARELDPGEHELVLRTSAETSSQGHAARIVQFVVDDPR